MPGVLDHEQVLPVDKHFRDDRVHVSLDQTDRVFLVCVGVVVSDSGHCHQVVAVHHVPQNLSQSLGALLELDGALANHFVLGVDAHHWARGQEREGLRHGAAVDVLVVPVDLRVRLLDKWDEDGLVVVLGKKRSSIALHRHQVIAANALGDSSNVRLQLEGVVQGHGRRLHDLVQVADVLIGKSGDGPEQVLVPHDIGLQLVLHVLLLEDVHSVRLHVQRCPSEVGVLLEAVVFLVVVGPADGGAGLGEGGVGCPRDQAA